MGNCIGFMVFPPGNIKKQSDYIQGTCAKRVNYSHGSALRCEALRASRVTTHSSVHYSKGVIHTAESQTLL